MLEGMMEFFAQIKATLAEPKCHATALRVAIVVGSILFTINHGEALINGRMNRARWIAGLFTYVVPYTVSMHGQSMRYKNN